jgi:DNA-binding CsgD family transcriptional regulator/tetratricopeptide (TPR) repeat protein
MELLERGGELAALDAALVTAGKGCGSFVLVSGEAGIGKTRLVTEWTARLARRARVLWGACDGLVTPVVLGPFRDIARELHSELDDTLVGDPHHPTVAYAAMLEALSAGPRPTVAVVEDVHWADAASLDLLKFLGRRITRVPVVVIATYRDDEVGPTHPLRLVIGDIAPDAVRRIPLVPLSEAAVAQLAGTTIRSVAEVYELTRGNPFLVTEFLAGPGPEVPATIRDAVFARLGRLPPEARTIAEMASVVPGRCERWLLGKDGPALRAAIAACRRQGLLEVGPEAVWFRHELARRAVEDALDPALACELHGRVAGLMAEHEEDPARIVHHAQQGGDIDRLVTFGPRAARLARAAAAHREAYAHYRRLWPHLDRLTPSERAVLLSEFTAECYYVDDQGTAIEAAEHALELYRRLGDRRGEGAMLRWISRVHWWTGDRSGALATGELAVAVLESLPPTPELAMAYSNLAQVHMLAHEADAAGVWASRAIETAQLVGDRAAESHALNNLGSALIRSGDDSGWALLRRSLDLALAEGLDEHAARAFSNLAWTALDVRDYGQAAELIERGIAFTSDREIHGDLYYLRAERARLAFEQARWDDAETEARWVLGRPKAPGITTLPALIVVARVKVRRGDADAADVLADAAAQAAPTGELQRIGPVAVGLAELAWLQGDVAGVDAAIDTAYRLTAEAPQPWVSDEIAFWKWRGGARPASLLALRADPYRLQVAGEWKAAAAAWRKIGCPYEEADTLADSDASAALLAALEIYDAVGAVPAAAKLRRRLRRAGVARVPRGPRPATRATPGGLTTRQMEVLALVAAGLTNAQIAGELYVSPKTVDHHVSAILAKLGVATRGEAVVAARRIGALDSPA